MTPVVNAHTKWPRGPASCLWGFYEACKPYTMEGMSYTRSGGEDAVWGRETAAQAQIPIGERVVIRAEASPTGDRWTPTGYIFAGTVVGGPSLLDGADVESVLNVLPDSPLPTGSTYSSGHPRYFPLESQWVEGQNEGPKYLHRYIAMLALGLMAQQY
jgi:hypothetical protein